jgi:hypothetical protein
MAKVKLTNVRLSFPVLFEAEQFDGKGPFNYAAVFLVEKDSANHKALIAGQNEVAKETWKDKAAAIMKNANEDKRTRFIKDGDAETYDGYAGMVHIRALRAKDKGRPLILDKKPKKEDGSDNILTQDDGKPYAGCYVNATVELWAQDNKYGKTIRAQLLAVQFAKDGDSFAAGSKGSSDEFEDLSDSGEDDLIGD